MPGEGVAGGRGHDEARGAGAGAGLLEPEDFRPADDAAQGQEPLRHRHLDRLHEALAAHHPVTARRRLHRRLRVHADHALESGKETHFKQVGENLDVFDKSSG